MTWQEYLEFDMDTNLRNEKDDINIIVAQNDDCVANIDINYDASVENEINEDEMRRAVLSGIAPTSIAAAGCTLNCGNSQQHRYVERMKWMLIISY